MAFILSLMYFLFGFLISKKIPNVRYFLSKILVRLFIPIVIMYNTIFYKDEYIILIIFSFSSSLILFTTYLLVKKDRLKALCFSYLNIGWLGVPLAGSIFGGHSNTIMIAMYVGGSLFGNTFASIALQTNTSFKNIFIKIIKAPPVIAIFVAFIIKFSGVINFIPYVIIKHFYEVSKLGMTFSGMCVLGMWLRGTRYTKKDILDNMLISFYKLAIGVILTTLIYLLLYNYELIKNNILICFFIFLLPPAANIVALETAYKNTGASANYIGSSTIVSIFYILLYSIIYVYII